MPKITIRVGAAADASLRNVYLPLVAAAALARQQVTAQMRGLATAQVRESERASKAQTRAANEAARESYRAQKASNDAIIRERQKQVSFEMREFDKRMRASKRAADAEEKDILRVAKAAERAEERKARAAKSAAQARRQSVANEFGGRAVSNIGQIGNGTRRVGNEIVSGLGVNTDISSNIGKGVSLETLAVNTINSGFGAVGKSGTKADVDKLISEIRATGDATSSDYNSMGAGLNAFTGKTGDLEMGRKIMTDMAKLAKATGADVNEMMAAGGDVWNQLRDGPGDANEKSERLLMTMRLFAKQGQMGNVEIKDLAVHMGRLSATAFKYTGTREKNLGILGALAQIAKIGGASGGAEAARGAGSFSRDITKKKALERFEEAGIDIYSDKSRMKIRNPEDIIADAYRKTKGDGAKITNLFQNDMSKRVIDGFGAVFEKAGGKDDLEAGIAAIREEFKRYTTSISDQDVNNAFELSQSGNAAKAQRFNNELEKISAEMAEKIAPELEKAAPHLVKFATVVAEWISWAAANPFKAVALALGASILKAGIETAIKNGVASLMKKMLEGGGAGGVPGAGGKAIPLMAAGAGGFLAGREIANSVADARDGATTEGIENSLRSMNAHARGAKISAKQEKAEELQRRLDRLEASKQQGREKGGINLGSAALNWITDGGSGMNLRNQHAANADMGKQGQMLAELGQLRAEIANLRTATLMVEVTNQPAAGGPNVDQGSRVGPGK